MLVQSTSKQKKLFNHFNKGIILRRELLIHNLYSLQFLLEEFSLVLEEFSLVLLEELLEEFSLVLNTVGSDFESQFCSKF